MEIVSRLGHRFFWEIETGNIVVERSEMIGDLVETTKEQDFEKYTDLQGLNPDKIEMTTFEYGQYAEDFAQATGYRFDPTTGEIQFSYPDPNDPDPPDPIYRKPLSAEVDALKTADLDNKEAIASLFEMVIGGMV